MAWNQSWHRFLGGQHLVSQKIMGQWTPFAPLAGYSKTATETIKMYAGNNPEADFLDHLASNFDDGVINKTLNFGAGANLFAHQEGSNNKYTLNFGSGNDQFHFVNHEDDPSENNTYILNGGAGMQDELGFNWSDSTDFMKLGMSNINGQGYYKIKHVPGNNIFYVRDFEKVTVDMGGPVPSQIPFSQFWANLPGFAPVPNDDNAVELVAGGGGTKQTTAVESMTGGSRQSASPNDLSSLLMRWLSSFMGASMARG